MFIMSSEKIDNPQLILGHQLFHLFLVWQHVKATSQIWTHIKVVQIFLLQLIMFFLLTQLFFLPISILCLFQQVISTQDSFFIFTCHFLSNIYVRSQGCLYNPFLCSFLEKEKKKKKQSHYTFMVEKVKKMIIIISNLGKTFIGSIDM